MAMRHRRMRGRTRHLECAAAESLAKTPANWGDVAAERGLHGDRPALHEGVPYVALRSGHDGLRPIGSRAG